MTDHMTAACDLPDGTQVAYRGQTYTALPVTTIGGARIRWHSPNGLAGDRGMDRMLDDGARVVGCDEQAVAEYRAMLDGTVR